MADELELKAVVPDPHLLRIRLIEAGATRTFVGEMEDRIYDRADELAARGEVLRVRTLRDADGRVEWLLGWKGPTSRSPEGYKLRDERECRVAAPPSPAAILEALGYRAVRAIDRQVEIFRFGAAALRIEVYPRMDVLLEVEGDPAGIEAAVGATGLPRNSFTADSLAAFVTRFEARGGHPSLAHSA